jgi:hypothetical protein
MERYPGTTPAETGSTSQGGQAAEQARQQGQQLAGQARQQASKLANRGGEQVKNQLANQKHQAAQRMTPVQAALREAAQQLRNQGQGPVAEYADKAADQVERFAGYLRENDVDQLLEEARSFARQRPALFLGSAAALGFFATRFLKSSSEEGASAGDGSSVSPTATSGARMTYGSEEHATALPPRTVEGSPTARRTSMAGPPSPPLSERDRTEPPRDLRGQ